MTTLAFRFSERVTFFTKVEAAFITALYWSAICTIFFVAAAAAANDVPTFFTNLLIANITVGHQLTIVANAQKPSLSQYSQ